MTSETLAMDHWLICPAELHCRLRDEFVPLADSQLLDLRLTCGAVECVPRLEDLRAQVQAALQQGTPAVRIVLPQLGRAEYEALGSFEPAQAARLHLYDFSARPEDVLGSLCTPEDAVAAALQAAGADQPVPMIVGAGVDERVRQTYAAALLQWQQSVAAELREEYDAEAKEGPWGDWGTLRLDPKVLQVAQARIATVEVSSAFGSSQPSTEGSELSLRWTADIGGVSVEIEAVLPQYADPDGDVMCLTLWLTTGHVQGPRRVILDLGGGSPPYILDDLRWQADRRDSGRIVIRRTEIIDAVYRQALQDAIKPANALPQRRVVSALAEVLEAFRAVRETLASGVSQVTRQAVGMMSMVSEPRRGSPLPVSYGGLSARGSPAGQEVPPAVREWQLLDGLTLSVPWPDGSEEIDLSLVADVPASDVNSLRRIVLQLGEAKFDLFAEESGRLAWNDNGKGKMVATCFVTCTPQLKKAIEDPDSQAVVIFVNE